MALSCHAGCHTGGLKVENVWLRGVHCHCDSFVSLTEGEGVHPEHTKMETLMDIMFHHGGTFKKNDDGILVYSPDNRTCLGDLDEDTLDVFFVRNYYKELGYDNILQCWWLPPRRSLDGGLRALTCDAWVSTPEVIAGKKVVVWLDDTCEGDLVSKKNTSEGPKADGNTTKSYPKCKPKPHKQSYSNPPKTNPVTIPNLIDDNTTPNPNPTRAHDKPILKPNSSSKPKPKSKHNPTSISKPKLAEKLIQKPNPSLKTKLRETTKACSIAKGKGKSKMKSKPQFLPRRITRSQAVGIYRRSANKGKKALHVDLTINDDSSDDDSSEDSSFKPIQEDSSSSEDNASMSKPRNKKLKDIKRGAYAAAKTKENIMQPDDALVEDVSDREVDLGFVGAPGIVDVYEALDPGAESDGANSWHSEEMKTPPNSEDELQSDEDSDEFLIFRNGARFCELQLQVGMKFNTKYEFREAVREYTIQEGRRIKFKKNDNIRCRVVCKVVYASRDCDDSCWKIKTFNDDHTCARENTNRAANREKGILCVHVCAALARVNKRPEDFYHQLCTMEAYNKTYAHHINPLPSQSLWEKSMYTHPQAPNIRRRPGALTKKRRKDVDEGNSGNKKAKPSGSLKRHLKPFTCRYCGVKGHTMRGCSKKRLDEVAATIAATKAAADKAKSNAAASTSEAGPQPHTAAAPVDKPPIVEIEISQPNYERSQDIVGSAAPAPSRPEKFPTKRRSSPPPQSIGVDPMQGLSVATSFRLANFMKFVPTPGFKAPRKKNN
ncbi:hypothetical protein Ahy_B06g081215 [Arachis hypogaea]|uniref:Uncharacterized protein n=1 Tax=Arachis hypogaea TaxID=3818 RepID=A0A444YKH9_ARAHY|nr:hypothetical protein Ahy_B06g081215 [Arachis hypogaea]